MWKLGALYLTSTPNHFNFASLALQKPCFWLWNFRHTLMNFNVGVTKKKISRKKMFYVKTVSKYGAMTVVL